MAASAKVKDPLEDLQQEVTCPLCLDTFEDPRVLSCQHTYCKHCLDAFLSRVRGASRSRSITCPECRKPTDASVGGVNGLPVAFKINRLKELVSKMQEERTAGGQDAVATPPGDPSNCTQHPSQTLDVYCRQCEEVVCRDCILFDKKHSNHPYDKLAAVAAEDRDGVAKRLRALLQKQPSINVLAKDAKNACHIAEESRVVLCAKISESFDRLVNAVEQTKQSEIEKFRNIADTRVKELQKRETILSRTLAEMAAVQSLVERGLKNLGNVDFVSRKKGMLLKIDQMNSRINTLSLDQALNEPLPQVLDGKSVEEVNKLCHSYLRSYHVVDPLQCTVKMSDGNSIKVDEVSVVCVFLKDSEGEACWLQQCVTVELNCTRFGENVSAKVMEQSPSCYEATLSPNLHTRGKCQVVVKVNGNIIGSKPVPVFVECPPHKLGEPVCIINDIQQPGCLKIVNKRMFCRTASGVCILDLDNTSKPPVQSGIFPRDGQTENWWPSEMAIDKTALFVSDPRNGKVHKFKLDGHFLKSTATNKDTLKTPNGLCVAPDGALYVCDSDNHCIHVFNPDLTLRCTFGSRGTAPGCFCWPDNIAFDSNGNFYITDYSNNRIQCFTGDCLPKWSAGTPGSRPCDLNEPNVMQVVGKTIFLTDLGGVSVFDTHGQFITRFASMCAASETKSSADGIAVDPDGFVFVSDTPRNRIIVF